MHPARCLAITLALMSAACASPDPAGSKPETAAKSSRVEPARKDEAEVVTGSRLPVRGAQPVRTIDKEEIMRDSRVIGVPAKGN